MKRYLFSASKNIIYRINFSIFFFTCDNNNTYFSNRYIFLNVQLIYGFFHVNNLTEIMETEFY